VSQRQTRDEVAEDIETTVRQIVIDDDDFLMRIGFIQGVVDLIANIRLASQNGKTMLA